MSDPSILAITPGEPAGIGPELIVQLAQSPAKYRRLVFADPDLLQDTAQKFNLSLHLKPFQGKHAPASDCGELEIVPIKLTDRVQAGTLNTRNAQYVLDCIQQACEFCLTQKADALVTGPIHKAVINDGLQLNQAPTFFSGHTEFLADICQVDRVVMMLASPQLRMALATTHLPLKDVPAAIQSNSLKETLNILHQDLRFKFGIESPLITVLGLNPHAGESGHLGREEIDIIEPVIQQLRQTGMNLIGPLPADTAFQADLLKQSDAYLAMYHDQGLPVLKYSGFGESINITLGLPIIRTSVDHGTALDLAGTGQADSSSFQAALETAAKLAVSYRI